VNFTPVGAVNIVYATINGAIFQDTLFEAVQVCAAFNLMNRLVEGSGVSFDYDKNDTVRRELRNRRQHSYLDFGRKLGVIPPEDDSLNV